MYPEMCSKENDTKVFPGTEYSLKVVPHSGAMREATERKEPRSSETCMVAEQGCKLKEERF